MSGTAQENINATIDVSDMLDGYYLADVRARTTNIAYMENATADTDGFWVDTRTNYNITLPCSAGGQCGEPSTYPCYFGIGWNSFALPLWALQNSTTLTYYNVSSVLESVNGNYSTFYADIGNNETWKSYVPGEVVNSFGNFTYNGATAVYYLSVNATDRIEIN